ncbi:YhcB family protein [Pseudoalteromonas aurantia]|uniref:Z-ring associated protein G n=1 Tax=Pseudoalteromonas aurantia TaxID=43654 RepID=A0ABY2W2X8_9GAMM|nr:YhcB family protein [Pseudoalteromonas aurantia]TMO64081.1 DUF1043 domain-containing protein [Pseudoalteromonas aurantia]TMO78712.1 DUF1043 domain-containing protein [Pseudoalteromonas aurantia]
MTTIVWLGLLIITGVIGFFIGAQVTRKQLKQTELEQQAIQAQTELEQYRQDVSDHLASTKKLMSKMQESYTQLFSHVERTDQVLLTEKPTHPSEPFFSKETTEQLHASLKSRPERRRDNQRSDGSAQPVDYVEGESGIFTGERSENKQANIS